ncbi:hypothetical protein AAFH96_35545 [Polymorphospora sp. 2-325]|uniref:Uncharacterized protein n=1 Tax=Polymorphospora lycopeni TaxID=3140240 RepID=A0ABV5D265_9ACTN
MDDVVLDEDQLVLLVGQAQQQPAQQRQPGHVERHPDLGGDDVLGGAGRVGGVAQVAGRDPDPVGRVDELDRVPVAGDHGGAQDLVPADHFGQRRLEQAYVDRAVQPDRRRRVVGDVAGRELLEEPDLLLHHRQRRGAPVAVVAGQLRQGRGAGGVTGAGRLDPRGQRGDGRVGQQFVQRQLDAEVGAQVGLDAGGEQRGAAEVEEGVVDADAGQVQHPRPDPPDARGGRVGGLVAGRCGVRRCGRGRGERGQRGPVDLAAGGDRQPVQPVPDGRHHPRRQPPGQPGGQRRRLRAVGAVDPGQVRRQPAAAGEDRRLGDVGVPGQDGLDLGRLDPEPAYLHLVVDPAQERQVGGVVGAPDPVAGPVHPGAGRPPRVGHEPFGGQVGAAEVAAGQGGAADVQLAAAGAGQVGVEHVQDAGADGGADRHGVRPGGVAGPVHRRGHHRLGRTVRVEDRRPVGADGGADRHGVRPGGVAGPVHRRGHHRLGRTVRVEDRRPVRADGGPPAVDGGGGQRLATGEDHAQRADGGGQQPGVAGGGQFGEQRGRQVGDGHRVRAQRRAHLGRPPDPVVAQDDPGTGGEAGEELLDGDVEAVPGHLEDHVVRGQPEVGDHRPDVGGGGAVLDHHALGHAGGAGGVDDVRGGVRVDAVAGHVDGRAGAGRVDDRHGGAGDGGRGPGPGDDDAYAGVGDQRGDARRRQVGGQRQVRRPGLQHAEDRHDEFGAAGGADPDDVLGAGAGGPQPGRQGGGAVVEFGVRQPQRPAFHRACVGTGDGVPGHQAVQRLRGVETGCHVLNSSSPCAAGR